MLSARRLPVILLPLAMLACEQDARRFEKRAVLPRGHIDSPASPRVELGPGEGLPISGWAVSEDGIAEVDVYVDRRLVRSLGQLTKRPDVGNAFPDIAHSSVSGIETGVDAAELGTGSHEVVVQVRSNRGAVAQLCLVETVSRATN